MLFSDEKTKLYAGVRKIKEERELTVIGMDSVC